MDLDDVVSGVRSFGYSLAVAAILSAPIGCQQPTKAKTEPPVAAGKQAKQAEKKPTAPEPAKAPPKPALPKENKEDAKAPHAPPQEPQTQTVTADFPDKISMGTGTKPISDLVNAYNKLTPEVRKLREESSKQTSIQDSLFNAQKSLREAIKKIIETYATKENLEKMKGPNSEDYNALNGKVQDLETKFNESKRGIDNLLEMLRLVKDKEKGNEALYGRLDALVREIDGSKEAFDKAKEKYDALTGELDTSKRAYDEAGKEYDTARKAYEEATKKAEETARLYGTLIAEIRKKAAERATESAPEPAPAEPRAPEAEVRDTEEPRELGSENYTHEQVRDEGKAAYLARKLTAHQYNNLLREIKAGQKPDKIRQKYLGGEK